MATTFTDDKVPPMRCTNWLCILAAWLTLVTPTAWAGGGAAAPASLQHEKIAVQPIAAPAWESASGIFHFSCCFASGVSTHQTRSASGFSARGLRIRIGSKDPTGLDWVWNFSGVMADGGEWVWDDKWEGRDGVKLTDAPDIAQRKPPAALSGIGRIGADWFIEQGLGQFLGNSDQELQQVRLRAQAEIAEEKAAGSAWTGPAIRPASPGYVNPDPAWVQSLDQFQNKGSRAAVVIQSGLAAVVLAPVAAAAWAESSLYARAFVKNPWLMTTAAGTGVGVIATRNGPAIVDTFADTGRFSPGTRNLVRSGSTPLFSLPGKGRGTTRLGVTRTNAADWRATRNLWDDNGYGAILSSENRALIAQGRTPIVDDAWIKYFTGDARLKGELIPMHHIGGTPIAVPLPASRHLDAHMPGGFRYNPGGPGDNG